MESKKADPTETGNSIMAAKGRRFQENRRILVKKYKLPVKRVIKSQGSNIQNGHYSYLLYYTFKVAKRVNLNIITP